MSWAQNVMHPDRSIDTKDYRISDDCATNLLRLVDLGIPAPDQVIWRPFAESYVRADLSRVGDGSVQVEWVWDIMSVQELSTLMNMVFASHTHTYAEEVIIRTDIRTGDYADPCVAFANYCCTMWRPNLSGDDGTPVAKSAYAIQSVRILFTNLEAV